ncbi:type IV secretory system conjugative DNA transfer family protein [Streptomyces sp. NRRL F-5126]|uniref:type IV secretory system conjugative DNA transfer family protein n=1 Tax=Streptomyces sp. NRRL F-5126 TaxID=1463857 RepID=UPI0004C804FD|nr:type IV secretory system conjugative DNA transfer family protein [Streptomyces sp. NRRL F-5126]
MARDDTRRYGQAGGSGEARGGRQGGVPDGLLLGLIAFILGLTVLVWTATGLGGLFTHGGWPDGVDFTRTPSAMRALVTHPHDLHGAWPATPPGQLSGYGLFWGLLISQLMVLTVLTVFVLGVVTRYRAVRASRRDRARREHERAYDDAYERDRARDHERGGGPDHEHPHAPPRPPAPAPAARDVLPAVPPLEQDQAQTHGPTEQPPPAAPGTAAVGRSPAVPAVPLPAQRAPQQVHYGDVDARRPTAAAAIRDAEGPALVVTSDPRLWSETKDARAKLGPVLVYDPGHLCDTPARLHWAPTTGCEDPAIAADRAIGLLAPVRPHAALDAAMADTAETLLRCWLHAAAVDGRPFRQVHRWAQGNGAQEAVRILRTHPKAASGHGGLLESALTAHAERREVAQQLTARALEALSSIHIRDACTYSRTDAVSLESFAAEGGTLYVVGEPIEDPRSRPGAMPLLTALASHVVEHGRRMAARSPDGRLDPPMSLVLDDVAAVAPLPMLPELLATGRAQGLPPLALLRSREQGRARWPRHGFVEAP